MLHCDISATLNHRLANDSDDESQSDTEPKNLSVNSFGNKPISSRSNYSASREKNSFNARQTETDLIRRQQTPTTSSHSIKRTALQWMSVKAEELLTSLLTKLQNQNQQSTPVALSEVPKKNRHELDSVELMRNKYQTTYSSDYPVANYRKDSAGDFASSIWNDKS
ncbi:hypothetical protein SNEBB_007621 [Seison nebaliae]|nr:hypothetical protein SNEBB_007621 [Seison nebaliae]